MWRRSRPDLIVPIHDRRRHKRILTIKNFRNAVIVLAVLFVGLTVYSELGGRSATSDYGRLIGRQLPATSEIARKPIEPITEGTVPDQNSADPMLVEPAKRAQYLGVETPIDAPAPVVATQSTPAPTPKLASMDHSLAIVGDSSGVHVVVQDRPRPQLSGGFGH